MSLRWVLAAFAVAVAAIAVPVGILVDYVALQARLSAPDQSQYTQAELEAWSRQLNDAWILVQPAPWLLAGGLIALSTAVALVALRAQRAASASASASASATASRDA